MMQLCGYVPLFLLAGCLPANVVFAETDAEFFEKRIRPLLVERCEICHSAANGKTSGGLALDTRERWQKGGDSADAVIIPGKPDESQRFRWKIQPWR